MNGLYLTWKKIYISMLRIQKSQSCTYKSHIEEYEYENKNSLNQKSNVYLGKISRVEPSLQAAFVNYGRERHGFLAFNDIQSDYYQIPIEDKEELKRAEEKIREDLKEESKDTEIKTNNNSEEEQNLNSSDGSSEIKDSKSENTEKTRERLKNRYGVRKYRIQEVIRMRSYFNTNKQRRGQKGVLTTFISLAGKYIVLIPNTAKVAGFQEKLLI